MNGSTLAKWRESFLEGGLGALRTRARDERDERIRELERKLGQVTMDNELLYDKIDKIDKMVAGVPLGRRRSKR